MIVEIMACVCGHYTGGNLDSSVAKFSRMKSANSTVLQSSGTSAVTSKMKASCKAKGSRNGRNPYATALRQSLEFAPPDLSKMALASFYSGR